jgi:hypothetical protein
LQGGDSVNAEIGLLHDKGGVDGRGEYVRKAAVNRLFPKVQSEQELSHLEKHDEAALHERNVKPAQLKAVHSQQLTECLINDQTALS